MYCAKIPKHRLMSVRVRLSIFYALLGFGFLVIFSVGMFVLAGALVNEQIDILLSHNAIHVQEHIAITEDGQIAVTPIPSVSGVKTGGEIGFQVWDAQNTLVYKNNPDLPETPLSEKGLQEKLLHFESTSLMGYRVLSVPIVRPQGTMGVLQMGYNLSVFSIFENEFTRRMLLFIFLAVVFTSVLVSLLINHDIKRIVKITHTVKQINESDDPSLRIVDNGSIVDEIGQLTSAFNHTMERLETIINSQRRFLSDVSHELRTPMTIIKGNVEIMRRFGAIDDESLDTIESQTDRLTRLVNSLLLLEQVETGQLPIQKTTVNLTDLLLEVFQELIVIAQGRQQRMQVNEIDLANVAGSRDQLKQVLVNLISNAINYTPIGGDIRLALRKEGGWVLVSVYDSGPGIPEDVVPHLFERFYRGEKSRSWQTGSGFGLGLSIAYWIVRNHNGHIEVNTKLGKGTEFVIWLPVSDTVPSKN